jgi:hypothetical protein
MNNLDLQGYGGMFDMLFGLTTAMQAIFDPCLELLYDTRFEFNLAKINY